MSESNTELPVAEPAAFSIDQASPKTPQRPEHYKVICISMYLVDLERLDDKVAQLKARGMTKANRSALIRQSLEQVDLDKIPRGM